MGTQVNQTDYIYLPNSNSSGGSTRNIVGLVNDLNKTKQLLHTKYELALRNIQDKYYLNTVIDKQLEQELQKEINNYKKMETGLFKKNKEYQNTSVRGLYDDLVKIKKYEEDLYKLGMTYNNITSLNGQQLTVSNIRDNKYMIHLNNQCTSSSSSNPFGLNMCDPNSTSQSFEVKPIYDDESYFAQFQTNPEKGEMDLYPYNILKSSLTGLCIEEAGGKITVNKCNSLKGQKWIGLVNPNGTKSCSK